MNNEPDKSVPQWTVKDWGRKNARLVAITPLPAGLYTLIAERWTDEKGLVRLRGDYLQLDAQMASRLGAEGAIAPPDSSWAKGARVHPAIRSANFRPDQEQGL